MLGMRTITFYSAYLSSPVSTSEKTMNFFRFPENKIATLMISVKVMSSFQTEICIAFDLYI